MGHFGRNKQQPTEIEEAEEKQLSQKELDKIARWHAEAEEAIREGEELEVAKEQAEQSKIQAFQELTERAKFYKPRWNKNGTIQFKSECICILQRKWGTQVEFIVAFEDLTREGYRLMAIDEGKTAGDSYTGGTNSYYYFQKMEYVTNVSSASEEFLTYENETANIRIQYPDNWTADEKNLESDEVVRIFPNDFFDERISPVGLVIYNISRSPSSNLSSLSGDFETYTKRSPDIRFINSADTMISGLLAHSTLYYDFRTGRSSKVLDTKTLFDNNLFNLHYYAKSKSFEKYLPQVQKMIDSFQLIRNVKK